MKTMPRTGPLRSKKLLWVGSWASFDSWRESSQKAAITASGIRNTTNLLTGHLPFRQNYGITGIVTYGSLRPFCWNLRTAVAANGHRQILFTGTLHEDVAGIAFERDIQDL